MVELTRVAPLVGAWIETAWALDGMSRPSVAPLVGAWIETGGQTDGRSRPSTSLPSWGRGLKLQHRARPQQLLFVAPLVGAWIETASGSTLRSPDRVAPLVGAWIETADTSIARGCRTVAPLVGAWIETPVVCLGLSPVVSRSPRGGVD